MNKIFSLKRFGRYFVYDLNNTRNNYGLSLLVTGLMPVILYVFYHLYSIIFTQGWGTMDRIPTYVILGLAVLIVTVTAPVKIYGGITDKKMGSDWLLIPASVFEKCLSMFLILGILVPCVFLAIFAGSDCLLGLLDSSHSATLIGNPELWNGIGEMIDRADGPSFTNCIFLAAWLNWLEGIFLFALGALCFKKGKVVKTILVTWLLSSVLSFILFPIITNVDFDFKDFFEGLTVERVEFFINFIINIVYAVVIGGLMAGIYFRVKTIKH